MPTNNFQLILKDVQGACQLQNPVYPTLVLFQGLFSGLNVHTWAQQHDLLDQLHVHLVGVEKAVGIVSQRCEERATGMVLEAQGMQEKKKDMEDEIKRLEGEVGKVKGKRRHLDEKIAESKRAIQSCNGRVDEARRGVADAVSHRNDLIA